MPRCSGYFPPPPHDRSGFSSEQALMIAFGSARIARCFAFPRRVVAGLAARAMRALRNAFRPSGVGSGFVVGSDPLACRTDRRERAPSTTAHRRLAGRQTPCLSRPRARPARAAREIPSQVAPRPAPGQARDRAAMAPGRIPTVLASESPPERSTRTASRAPRRRPHPPHGDRQSALGMRVSAHRERPDRSIVNAKIGAS
jgi:hypothetical protein